MRTLPMLALAAALSAAAACAGPAEQAAPSPDLRVPSPESRAPSPEETAATISQLEREWVDAIVAKDTATIERLLADDFIGATEEMTYSKSEAIEDVKHGEHKLEMQDVDVRVFGDAAVVMLDQIEDSMHGEEPFTGHYRFTNVWVRRNGEWQAVASHGSRVR